MREKPDTNSYTVKTYRDKQNQEAKEKKRKYIKKRKRWRNPQLTNLNNNFKKCTPPTPHHPSPHLPPNHKNKYAHTKKFLISCKNTARQGKVIIYVDQKHDTVTGIKHHKRETTLSGREKQHKHHHPTPTPKKGGWVGGNTTQSPPTTTRNKDGEEKQHVTPPPSPQEQQRGRGRDNQTSLKCLAQGEEETSDD